MSFSTKDAPNRLQPCIVGVGESTYTKRGGHNDQSEFELCVQAIRNAAADAGIDASQINGYTSFGFERHEPVLDLGPWTLGVDSAQREPEEAR